MQNISDKLVYNFLRNYIVFYLLTHAEQGRSTGNHAGTNCAGFFFGILRQHNNKVKQ